MTVPYLWYFWVVIVHLGYYSYYIGYLCVPVVVVVVPMVVVPVPMLGNFNFGSSNCCGFVMADCSRFCVAYTGCSRFGTALPTNFV